MKQLSSESEKIRNYVWRFVFANKQEGKTIAEISDESGYDYRKLYCNIKALAKKKILLLYAKPSERILRVFLHPEFLRKTS